MRAHRRTGRCSARWSGAWARTWATWTRCCSPTPIPVHRLTIAARELSAANLDQRLHLTGPRDELTELGDTFDQMLSRLEAAFQSQRRFIANASHELRTP